MPQEKRHDLHDFMQQISAEMAAEYNRIQMRATEDPGTAGDQGEENWAELLRDWLPRNYEVVTKGRIISEQGVTSPQIDVLVLKGSYPKKLLSKKLYLAAGVAAAFECKTTLKASHIEEAIQNCVAIKSLYPARTGTPYRELHSPVIYGLLAHSHSWKGNNSTPGQNIHKKLDELDDSHVHHPRLQLDLLCVADLAIWGLSKITLLGPAYFPPAEWAYWAPTYGPHGSAVTSYAAHADLTDEHQQYTPVGAFISFLSQKLAWEDPSVRDLADYYRTTLIGPGHGNTRLWPTSVYSDQIRSKVETERLLLPLAPGKEWWDEWQFAF